MRVGVLRGGLELESEKAIPPSQRLEIIRGQALARLRSDAASNEHHGAYDDERRHGDSDYDGKGLPSPPLSTGALDSGDEAGSQPEEIESLRLSH